MPEHLGADLTLLSSGMLGTKKKGEKQESATDMLRLTQHFSQGCDFSRSRPPALGRPNCIRDPGPKQIRNTSLTSLADVVTFGEAL